jgi:hypothetical protein
MTFLHKLAKRLARIPALSATLFLLSSCGDGQVQDYLGPDPNPSKNFVSLSIAPRDPQVALGDSIRFAATGWLSSGKSEPIPVSWSASGGSITSTGWFRPDGVGAFEVRAVATSRPGLADSVRVAAYSLVSGIARFEVLPSLTAVPRGASQQFVAHAILNDGSTVTPTVAWSATGGTISSSGLFTASGPTGSASVSATLGVGLASAQSEIVIQPAALTQLVLDPGVTTMESGEIRQLTLGASWTDGSSSLPPVIWNVEGGTLDAQNVYTAGGAPGHYRVIAASPAFAKADTTVVWILPRLVGVRVAPATATLSPGANQPMQVYAIRSDGSESPAGVQWTATGGSIGINGTYTAGEVAGQYQVVVNLQGLDGSTFSDTAQMAISGGTGTLTQISVTPRQAVLPEGDPLQFSVNGSWSDGTSAVPAVTWSVTGGSIDAAGLYIAPLTVGSYKVVGRHKNGSHADTATVTVAPKLLTFRIAPKVDTLEVSQTLQYSATLTWSDGQTHPVTIAWSSTGGAISSDGVFSPGMLAGSFLVVAACSCGAADTASVTVRSLSPPASPTLTSLTLSPHSIVLAPGGVQQFSPTGTWSDGSTGAVGVIYDATGGNISSAGFYVAGTVTGTWRVIAIQQGGTKADTATVTIGSEATLNQLVLNPAAVTVAPGASQQFSVSGVWSNGSTATPSVVYSATGGSITSAGLYTAGATQGTYAVTATQQGGSLSVTSVVTVSTSGPTLTQLVMTPSTAAVFPGSTQLFSVRATWSDGSSTLPPLSFSATGGTISGAGLYTAGTAPGTYQVIVKHQGGTKADTSAVTIPTLTSLTLTPKPDSVGAGGSQLFSVAGTWSNGATTPPQVTYSATGGTISPAGQYVAGITQGTFRVIAQHSYGTRADTSVVTITAAAPPPPPPAWDPNDLVVYPSPEVEFIIGPQLKAGSASNPWPWFDQNMVTMGLVHGAAFPADPTTMSDHNAYLNLNYYDLGLALYGAYYRTGDPTLLSYARKVADSWWLDVPRQGTNTNWDNTYAPRGASLGGLMLRALDGRPEMWPWIVGYTRHMYDIWLGNHLNDSQLYYGVRDGGYMLLYAAWLAKVSPDPAIRAEFTTKARNAAIQYYARLQYSDGSWRWLDSYAIPGYEYEPFMVGLLLDGMVATHRLTGDQQILNAITNSVVNLYSVAYRKDELVPGMSVKWRGMWYYYYGTTCLSGCGRTALTGTDTNGIREVRQLNPSLIHAFGYAYTTTRDDRYRQWGDEIFAATFGKGQGPGADAFYGLADFREKEYNASYRSAGRYLVWRLGL